MQSGQRNPLGKLMEATSRPYCSGTGRFAVSRPFAKRKTRDSTGLVGLTTSTGHAAQTGEKFNFMELTQAQLETLAQANLEQWKSHCKEFSYGDTVELLADATVENIRSEILPDGETDWKAVKIEVISAFGKLIGLTQQSLNLESKNTPNDSK
jgi:hypothetical protein